LGLLLLYITIGLFAVIGIFTPNDELAKEVVEASQRAGEKLWRLPLEESYWESMKSGVADMVNTGGRQGGSITAALFLKQVNFCFLYMSVPLLWCHNI
jgi:leucyl aminopeptidase